MISWTRAWALALVTLVPLSVPKLVMAQELPREEIEQIVRDYLMREPEVIYEAIQEFQRRQEQVEIARQQELLTTSAEQIFADPRDPVVNPEGDVVLVEFFDYRCGYCRAMTDGLEQLVENDTGLKLVFKEFPILGEDSTRAAQAALAADMQGGYQAMHFALMRARDLSMPGILELAKELELDPVQLAQDMASDEVASHLDDTIQLARSLGINGTPSFVFEDQLLPGAVPVEQLAQIVADKRG